MKIDTSVDFGARKIWGTWDSLPSTHGKQYIVPLNSEFEREGKRITVEFRIHFDPAKTIADSLGRPGHRMLREGLSLKDATAVEIEPT